MDFFHLSIIGTMSGTILAVLIYVYLYITYRERYMGIWILSWLCYFIRLAFVDVRADYWQNNILPVAFVVITAFNAFLLASGTHEFIGRKMKSYWIYITVAATVLGSATMLLNISFLLRTLTIALFFGVMYIWTGIVFLQNIKTRGFGVKITGLSLILLGIHGIDFAFFRPVENLAPVGYFIDALLRCIIAIGTLLVYFEKTRSDLTRKEEYYRLLTENAVDAIYRYRLAPQPGFEYISPSITTITGYSPDEYYADAQLLDKLVHAQDRHLFKDFAQAHSLAPLTLRLIRKDGREIWIEQNYAPVYSENGQVQVVEGILRDATVRKQLEQEISRHERLNTVGEMAANLAHEIRNPMTTVRGYLQMLSGRHELTGYRGQFDLMVEELDRANSIICEYLSFCKDKMVDAKLCQLNKVIEAIFPLIQASANAAQSNVELELADIPEIYVDEKEMRQVILNLARNGLEAMPSGGTLTIRTYVEAGRVILAIQDQGTGIPAHVLEKLGTPFFTTKEMGTGLGLAVCYRIANRYKAVIKVKTNSEGTTFLLYFTLPDSGESMQP